jgi:hypothetical protein
MGSSCFLDQGDAMGVLVMVSGVVFNNNRRQLDLGRVFVALQWSINWPPWCLSTALTGAPLSQRLDARDSRDRSDSLSVGKIGGIEVQIELV